MPVISHAATNSNEIFDKMSTAARRGKLLARRQKRELQTLVFLTFSVYFDVFAGQFRVCNLSPDFLYLHRMKILHSDPFTVA